LLISLFMLSRDKKKVARGTQDRLPDFTKKIGVPTTHHRRGHFDRLAGHLCLGSADVNVVLACPETRSGAPRTRKRSADAH
jgi:hypothetical protein